MSLDKMIMRIFDGLNSAGSWLALYVCVCGRESGFAEVRMREGAGISLRWHFADVRSRSFMGSPNRLIAEFLSISICCRVLQSVAECCRVLQSVAECCSVLQSVDCCAEFLSVSICEGVLQCVAECCSVLQWVAVCCSVLQCVAVCCRVLQSVAECCSVLQT